MALKSLSALYGYEKSVYNDERGMIEGTQETITTVKPFLDAKQLEGEWCRYEGMVKGPYANLSVERL